MDCSPFMEVYVYDKPRLHRFGSFGELTQTGGTGSGDSLTILSPISITINGNPTSDPDQNGCIKSLTDGSSVYRCSL